MNAWVAALVKLQWEEALLVDAWVDGREFSALSVWDSHALWKLDQIVERMGVVAAPPPQLERQTARPSPPPPRPQDTLRHFGEQMDRPNVTHGNFAGMREYGLPELHCALSLEQWQEVERWNAIEEEDELLVRARRNGKLVLKRFPLGRIASHKKFTRYRRLKLGATPDRTGIPAAPG